MTEITMCAKHKKKMQISTHANLNADMLIGQQMLTLTYIVKLS